MSNKKIAIILSGFQLCYLEKLCDLFRNEGYQIDFYANNTNYPEYILQSNIFYFDTPIHEKKPVLLKKLNSELKNLMKGKKYEHILSDCAPISFGCNVFHSHSLEYRKKLSPNFIYEFIFTLMHLKKLNYFKKWHTSEHEKIFVVSNEMKKDYAKALSIPKEKIAVLIPGTNSGQIDKIAPINFAKDKFTLGISANGFSSKGGYILLDAMRHIKNKNINCKMIYPKHEKNFFLKFLVKIMGIQDRVEFLGYQNNMPEFYNSIDALVASSLAEPFGRVVTEAMVQKRPVILGSNVGACDIIKDGENGFIYKFNKISGKNLAKKIEEVYARRNNLDELIQKANETAIGLTWDNFAEQMFKELTQKLSQNTFV